MFTGSVPPEARLVIQELLAGRKGDLYVACSGNYTIDRIGAAMGFNVHSNDVALYSKLIADVLLGTETDLEVLDKDLLQVFSDWSPSRYKNLIQVMFAVRVAGFAACKNDYQKMFYGAYVEGATSYYERTMAKFEKDQSLEFKIKSFYYGDFVDFLKMGQENGICLAFPPTYKGGYEKLYSYIESSFDYERAKYEMYDPKTNDDMLLSFLQNGEHILYLDRSPEQLEEFCKAKIRLDGDRKVIYIYSSVKKSPVDYYLEKRKPDYAPVHKLLSYDHVFSKKDLIEISPCSTKEANHWKAFFMSAKVNYTEGGDICLVFLCNKRAFGFAVFKDMTGGLEYSFLHSDFVINMREARVSKLLILLLKASEVRSALSRFYKVYYTGIFTSVYTDKPISMKYRGAFDLMRREKGKLMYKADFAGQKVKEIYNNWFHKHANKG